MSFRLTDTFDGDFLKYEGHKLHLNLCFDNVLRAFELFEDDMFNGFEKVDIALEIFVEEYELIEGISIEEKAEMLMFIFREFLDLEETKPESDKEDAESQEVTGKSFDFTQDAGIIYASFLHVYNMDLFEQQGKLHWKKFIQLLQHIDDKSKFKEVVNIRKMPLPKADKYNSEYRRNIAKLKQVYALDKPQTEEEAAEKVNRQLSSIADALKRQTKPKGR